MSTFVMIHHFSSQEIFWLKQSGVWWILVAFAGALALVFLHLYFKWKKIPVIPASIIDVEKKKGSRNTVYYLIQCEYTAQNGEKRTAVYSSTKAPAGQEIQVRINPKHPDKASGPEGLKMYMMLFVIFLVLFIACCIAGAL